MSGATGQGWHDPFPGRPYGGRGHDDAGRCPFCEEHDVEWHAHDDLHHCDCCDTWFDDDDEEVPAPDEDDDEV